MCTMAASRIRRVEKSNVGISDIQGLIYPTLSRNRRLLVLSVVP